MEVVEVGAAEAAAAEEDSEGVVAAWAEIATLLAKPSKSPKDPTKVTSVSLR